MLVSTKEMLEKARREGYAVGSFNIFNMESAKCIVAAAEAENAPVILQVWSGFADFIGLDSLGAIACCEAARAKVPVAVHLDHGATLGQVGQAVAAGFTSVMLDGSALPLEENVRISRTVVDFCREAGIPVEGEIGHVGGPEYGGEKDDIIYTDPEEAERYWKESGVDYVAVSIGTFHGTYDAVPQLNIELLKEIAARISAPLVLHGSSYTPDEQLAEAVKYGISKINVATEVNNLIVEETEKRFASGAASKFVADMTDEAYAKAKELVRHKIRLFGGSGRA